MADDSRNIATGVAFTGAGIAGYKIAQDVMTKGASQATTKQKWAQALGLITKDALEIGPMGGVSAKDITRAQTASREVLEQFTSPTTHPSLSYITEMINKSLGRSAHSGNYVSPNIAGVQSAIQKDPFFALEFSKKTRSLGFPNRDPLEIFRQRERLLNKIDQKLPIPPGWTSNYGYEGGLGKWTGFDKSILGSGRTRQLNEQIIEAAQRVAQVGGEGYRSMGFAPSKIGQNTANTVVFSALGKKVEIPLFTQPGVVEMNNNLFYNPMAVRDFTPGKSLSPKQIVPSQVSILDKAYALITTQHEDAANILLGNTSKIISQENNAIEADFLSRTNQAGGYIGPRGDYPNTPGYFRQSNKVILEEAMFSDIAKGMDLAGVEAGEVFENSVFKDLRGGFETRQGLALDFSAAMTEQNFAAGLSTRAEDIVKYKGFNPYADNLMDGIVGGSTPYIQQHLRRETTIYPKGVGVAEVSALDTLNAIQDVATGNVRVGTRTLAVPENIYQFTTQGMGGEYQGLSGLSGELGLVSSDFHSKIRQLEKSTLPVNYTEDPTVARLFKSMESYYGTNVEVGLQDSPFFSTDIETGQIHHTRRKVQNVAEYKEARDTFKQVVKEMDIKKSEDLSRIMLHNKGQGLLKRFLDNQDITWQGPVRLNSGTVSPTVKGGSIRLSNLALGSEGEMNLIFEKLSSLDKYYTPYGGKGITGLTADMSTFHNTAAINDAVFQQIFQDLRRTGLSSPEAMDKLQKLSTSELDKMASRKGFLTDLQNRVTERSSFISKVKRLHVEGAKYPKGRGLAVTRSMASGLYQEAINLQDKKLRNKIYSSLKQHGFSPQMVTEEFLDKLEEKGVWTGEAQKIGRKRRVQLDRAQAENKIFELGHDRTKLSELYHLGDVSGLKRTQPQDLVAAQEDFSQLAEEVFSKTGRMPFASTSGAGGQMYGVLTHEITGGASMSTLGAGQKASLSEELLAAIHYRYQNDYPGLTEDLLKRAGGGNLFEMGEVYNMANAFADNTLPGKKTHYIGMDEILHNKEVQEALKGTSASRYNELSRVLKIDPKQNIDNFAVKLEVPEMMRDRVSLPDSLYIPDTKVGQRPSFIGFSPKIGASGDFMPAMKAQMSYLQTLEDAFVTGDIKGTQIAQESLEEALASALEGSKKAAFKGTPAGSTHATMSYLKLWDPAINEALKDSQLNSGLRTVLESSTGEFSPYFGIRQEVGEEMISQLYTGAELKKAQTSWARGEPLVGLTMRSPAPDPLRTQAHYLVNLDYLGKKSTAGRQLIEGTKAANKNMVYGSDMMMTLMGADADGDFAELMLLGPSGDKKLERLEKSFLRNEGLEKSYETIKAYTETEMHKSTAKFLELEKGLHTNQALQAEISSSLASGKFTAKAGVGRSYQALRYFMIAPYMTGQHEVAPKVGALAMSIHEGILTAEKKESPARVSATVNRLFDIMESPGAEGKEGVYNAIMGKGGVVEELMGSGMDPSKRQAMPEIEEAARWISEEVVEKGDRYRLATGLSRKGQSLKSQLKVLETVNAVPMNHHSIGVLRGAMHKSPASFLERMTGASSQGVGGIAELIKRNGGAKKALLYGLGGVMAISLLSGKDRVDLSEDELLAARMEAQRQGASRLPSLATDMRSVNSARIQLGASDTATRVRVRAIADDGNIGNISNDLYNQFPGASINLNINDYRGGVSKRDVRKMTEKGRNY